jgi:hypothetical protein
MAWKLHTIEQKQLRRQHRVDVVGRPIFDFHTVPNWLHGNAKISRPDAPSSECNRTISE